MVHRILVALAICSAALLIAGCLNDDFLDTIKQENAYYSFSVNESDPALTTYFPISDSGQTTEYLSGDDGSYLNIPNAINLSTTVIAGGDVVIDHTTGLMWTKCSAIAGNSIDSGGCGSAKATYIWQDAYNLCDDLTYAGFDDWKLPTAPEIFSIINFNYDPPNDLSIFPDTITDKYWASTPGNFVGFPVYWFVKGTSLNPSLKRLCICHQCTSFGWQSVYL